MTYIQKVNLNGEELYRVYVFTYHCVNVNYYTLEEVLYILSTKEE